MNVMTDVSYTRLHAFFPHVAYACSVCCQMCPSTFPSHWYDVL